MGGGDRRTAELDVPADGMDRPDGRGPALNGGSASASAGSSTVSFASVSVTTTSVQPDTATPTSNSDPTPTPTVSITPTVLTTLLSNPGMGLESMYGTKATDHNNGTLNMGPAYTRYYWSQVEPSEGDFAFTQIVNDYNAGRRRGRTIAFALNPMITSLVAVARRGSRRRALGYTFNAEGGPNNWAPNMSDPTVMAEYQKLIQALGGRFDGLPGFGPIDIGSIGLWGEWHNYSTDVISTNGNPRHRST